MSKKNRISIDEAYDIYKKNYMNNVDIIMQTKGFDTGTSLLKRMDTKEEFEANIKNYQYDYKQKHIKSHGESLDRLSKWTANQQTRLRSAKQAKNIVGRAKAAGYDGPLTMNDIYYGTIRAEKFWDWYMTLKGDENFWGS